MSAGKKNNNKDKKKKDSFWKKAWYIITNKNTGGEHYLTETMVMLTGMFLNLLAIFSVISAILGGIFFFVKICPTFLWGTFNQIVSSIAYIVLFLGIETILLLLSLMLKGSANEISKQKSKNYVTAVFSGMASFAAMIISLILLVKEFVK